MEPDQEAAPLRKKLAITVTSTVPTVPVAQLGSVPVVANSGALVLPSDEQFQLIVSQTEGAEALRDLHAGIAACEQLAKQFKLALSDVIKLASNKLRAERKLGLVLPQVVHRGGHGSKSLTTTSKRGGTSAGLPEWIDKHEALAYRRLAAIPVDSFEGYLATAATSVELPTRAAALRLRRASKPGARKSKPRQARRTQKAVLPPAVLEAVSRVMTPDVCVGTAELESKRLVSPNAKNLFDELTGDVFVAECPDAAIWLTMLRKLRNKARIQQAIVALPAEVWADWLSLLQHEEWVWCFLKGARDEAGRGRILAHCGAKESGFRVALAEIGTLL